MASSMLYVWNRGNEYQLKTSSLKFKSKVYNQVLRLE